MNDSYPTFEEWLAVNPEPSLTALIEQYKYFSAIPVEAWEKYDAAMTKWRADYKHRHLP